MQTQIFKAANKIWTTLAKQAEDKALDFELQVHKQLLNFFQVGDYYYYIFNVKNSSLELLSPEVFDIWGYKAEELDVPYMLSCIHPDDQPWFIKFEEKVVEFFSTLTPQQILNYKVRYDYRIKNKDGDYVRILQQVITIQFDENNGILRTFGVHTDITHIKKDGLPVLSFIGMNGYPSFNNINVKQRIKEADNTNLTKREKEILICLLEGKSSEEIAQLFFISKLTVDVHRRNMLQKTNSKNTAVLLSRAIKQGWV